MLKAILITFIICVVVIIVGVVFELLTDNHKYCDDDCYMCDRHCRARVNDDR